MTTLECTAKEFLQLHRQAKAAEKAAAAAKEAAAVAEADLREKMSASGIQSINIQGAVLFLHRQIWASPVKGSGPELLRRLRADPWTAPMVKESVNTQTLSSYVREFERDADGMPLLPDELKGLVNVTDRVQVRVRQS